MLQASPGNLQCKGSCSNPGSSSPSLLMRVAVQHLQAAASTKGRGCWPSQLHLGDAPTCGKLRRTRSHITTTGPLPRSRGLGRKLSQE